MSWIVLQTLLLRLVRTLLRDSVPWEPGGMRCEHKDSRAGERMALSLRAMVAALAVVMGSLELQGVDQSVGMKLNPGDIVYADSGDAIQGGMIIRVDAQSGQQTVISSGVNLRLPFVPVIDGTGRIVVSDSG